MTGAKLFLDICVYLSLSMLSLAFLLTTFRIIRGPTLANRILGLDTLVAVAIGFIAVYAVKTGAFLYIDVAIALALVGFLATVAFARFILERARSGKYMAEAGQ